MLKAHFLLVLGALLLTGCNSPTLLPGNETPHFSSEDYEHLSCQELKNKIDRLNLLVDKLSGVDNENHYVMHTDMPFVGTGDNMGAVEFLRAKAERNSVQRTYGKKECQSQLID